MSRLDEYKAADIYAAMADDEDDAADNRMMSRPLIGGGGTVNLVGRTVPVTVGDKTVDVPTMAYISRLEAIVHAQKLALEKTNRMMRMLEQMLRQQKTALAHHANNINDMGREIDYKIDRRD
jgi:hypothetical protein